MDYHDFYTSKKKISLIEEIKNLGNVKTLQIHYFNYNLLGTWNKNYLVTFVTIYK
jgi:hypothetical protein